MTPETIFPSVDLPAPFSPTSAWIDPRAICRLTASRARDAAEGLADVPQLDVRALAAWMVRHLSRATRR